MWTTLRKTAERGLTEVSENAKTMASRATDVLREAHVEAEDEFGGEDFGFVIGEDAERLEELRLARKRIEELEQELHQQEGELRVSRERELEAREEMSKEAELRSSADAETQFYLGEKEKVQRTLVEMETQKAELADQLTEMIRAKDREIAGLKRCPQSPESALPKDTAGALEAGGDHPAVQTLLLLTERMNAHLPVSAHTRTAEMALRELLELVEDGDGEKRKEIARLGCELRSSNEELTILRAEFDSTSSAKEALERENGARRRAAEAENSRQATDLRTKLEEMEEVVQVQQSAMEALKASHQTQTDELQSKLTRSVDEMEALGQDYDELQAAVEQKSEQLAAMQAMRTDVETAERSVVEMVAERARDQEELKVARQSLSSAQDEIRDLLGHVEELRDQNARLRPPAGDGDREAASDPQSLSVTSLQERLSESDALIRELRDEVKSLRNDLSANEAEESTADRGIVDGSSATSELNSLREERDALTAKNMQMETDLEHLESDLRQSRDSLDSHQQQLAETRRRLELMEDILEKTRHECDELKIALKNAGTSMAASSKSTEELVRSLETELALMKKQAQADRSARFAMEEKVEQVEMKLATERSNVLEIQRQKEVVEDSLQGAMQDVSTQESKVQRLESEMVLAQKTAVNLQGVLEAFQASRDAEIEVGMKTVHRDLEEERQKRERLEEASSEARRMVEQLERAVIEKEQRIFHLQSEVEGVKEHNLELKEEMERVLTNMHSPDSENELVDRRVVKKLLVSYIESRRRRDVLELMSRMLMFSDEEKVKVGLRRRGLGDVFSALVRPPKGDGDTFEDVSSKWVEYLMKETEEIPEAGVDIEESHSPEEVS